MVLGMRGSVLLCLAAFFSLCAAAPSAKQERCDCEFCECIHGHDCVDGLCVPRKIVGICTLAPTPTLSPSPSPTCVPAHSHTTVVSIKDGAKDDGEERVSDGYVVTDSRDLDMVRDKNGGSLNQLVGLRFVNLGIPTRSTIQQAYITFSADEDDTEPTWLEISAEATDNARKIVPFPFDISSRPRTKARVNWTNVPSWEVHHTYDTPDLRSILQELVNNPKFHWGNSVFFILKGKGKRVAESFEGVTPGPLRQGPGPLQIVAREEIPPGAPKLTVVWTPSTYSLSRSISESQGDTQELISSGNLMEFLDGVPSELFTFGGPGLFNGVLSQIFVSRGLGQVGALLGGPGQFDRDIRTAVRPRGRLFGPSRPPFTFRTLVLTETDKSDRGDSTRRTILRFSHLNLPKMAVIKRAFITFTAARDDDHPTELKIHDEAGNAKDGTLWNATTWIARQKYDSADISSILQKLVDSSDWVAGNDVTIFISGHGKRVAFSFDQDPKLAPMLTVYYKSNTPAFITPIRGGNNDGYKNVLSENQVLFKTNPNQPAGFRFRGVYVPQGAFITNAFIKFTGAPGTSPNARFTSRIFAERRGFSSRFVVNSIASRERTHTFATWTGDRLWGPGDVVKTPDLRRVIQEVVDLNAWKKGNSLTFVVETLTKMGGTLSVVSFEGNEHKAAELVIFYNPIAKSIKQRVREINFYILGSPPTRTFVIEMPAIGVPKGVTILEATIRVTSSSDVASVSNRDVLIQVQRFAQNEAQLTTLNNIGTIGSKSFLLPDSVADGQFIESANLKDTLQGSVNQGDWDGDSGFRFLITTQANVPVLGFDSDPKKRPMLKIVYEDPSSAEETCW